jgi:hypothetical protein
LVCVALAACQTAHVRFAPLDRPTAGTKVLLMPLDVELAEMSAGGMLDPKADWTENAKAHMLTALDKEAVGRGISFVKLGEPAEGTPEADLFNQLEALHGAVGKSILIHEYMDGAKLPSKNGQFDWTLGTGAAQLGKAYDTDYALFLYVRDSYTSAGRAAAMFLAAALFGVYMQGGTQLGFASLVDLKTGNVVWFNRLARGAGDLRTEAPAEETVKTLLTSFPK